MQAGEETIVADRILGALTKKRTSSDAMSTATPVNVAGRWELAVAFFSSTSKHSFYLEQDGNWLQGTHQSDFSVQELMGTVEGDQVRIRSGIHNPGDHITYLFSGTISGDTFTGSIYLGEYQTAKFSAKRSTYKAERRKVVIPGGPPLAT